MFVAGYCRWQRWARWDRARPSLRTPEGRSTVRLLAYRVARRTRPASSLGPLIAMNDSASESEPIPGADEIAVRLQSESPGERARGVHLLRYLEDPDRFNTLMNMLEDVDSQVRYAAVTLFATVGGYDRQRTKEAMLQVLRNEQEEATVRAGASDTLGALRMHEVLPDLEDAFRNSKDWVVRFSVIAALGELGAREAFPLLEEALQLGAEEPLVQLAAIGALGDLGDPRALPLLEPLLQSKDRSVAERAQIALDILKTKLDAPPDSK
ncbi:hypothetical protein CDCA_CDCA16G4264 [Cyanidium caldarium]|uniref:HEAT repeat domain-containing protein n=1 Tax=Cyanidium caldarium TaxID=2771 RepID=A0AAV9J120_CYACA|nr:hypothetical protein CDCA_CDCA16G4264 [Cyanidium caldarium]